MTPDHYATLGISPASDEVAIRAAYLALMRRYHPDRNSSADAAAHARSVTAAYAVLGNQERRAEYDYRRDTEVSAKALRHRPHAKPLAPFAAAAIMLSLLVVAVIWSPLSTHRPNRMPSPQVREAAKAPKQDPAALCSSKATYDRIKRELFRRAARLRGSDEAALEKLAGYSLVRADSPVLTGQNEVLGTVSCRATIAVDLPPGVAVLGGRRTLTDDIRYSLEADGSALITVSNEGLIVTPLATLARVARPVDTPVRLPDAIISVPSPAGPRLGEPQPAPRAPLPPPAVRVAPQPIVPQPKPSFSCRFAKGRGEVAVCANANLARLDRHLAMLYAQSWVTADPAKRESLVTTRDSFLARRDACRSVPCVNRAYVGRMREISAIMTGN